MSNAAVLTLTASLLAWAANGCSAYSDGSSRPVDDKPSNTEPNNPPDVPPDEPALTQTQPEPDAGTPSIPKPPKPPVINEPDEMDASTEPVDETNLRFVRSSSFDGYLSDALGQPLYMFVNDITHSGDSACLGDCARTWPPFDVADAHPVAELERSEIDRIHRTDGKWQIAYKGHPLYYYAAESGKRDVTADGLDSRWYVARDYLAFLASAVSFLPVGATGTNSVFLTDGFGRTLYVCLEDTPGTNGSAPVSSCDAQCTVDRPIFATSATGRSTLLPSAIDPGSLRELLRPDGQLQVTYRGWPLYYYSGDDTAGSAEGHNDRAWRAIDPVTFGLTPPPDTMHY